MSLGARRSLEIVMHAVFLAVGIGNSFGGDDSVGIEVVRSLRNQEGLDCDLLIAGQREWDQMELWDREGCILFIDAVNSGADPGTVHLIPLPSAELGARQLKLLSSHGFGLADIIGLRQALKRSMPRCMLLGIEIESAKTGASQSEKVEHARWAVVSRFAWLLRELKAPASYLWREAHRYSTEEFGVVDGPKMEQQCAGWRR